MHVRTAHKLLKRFPRYDQKLFMNVVTYDESWLSFVVSTVSLLLSHRYPGSGVVLDCIDS